MQLLKEFYVTVTRKLRLPAEVALSQVPHLGMWNVYQPSYADLIAAIETHQSRKISFWDAMVVQSASRLGCHILWSEDLADGQRLGDLQIRNPFGK